MIDEKKLIEAFKAREMPAIDIIVSVINSQPKVGECEQEEISLEQVLGALKTIKRYCGQFGSSCGGCLIQDWCNGEDTKHAPVDWDV